MKDDLPMSTKENASTRKGRSAETRPAASVNMDELRELIELLRDNGLAELELEREDFRVKLKREWAAPSAPPAHLESAPNMAQHPPVGQQAVVPPHPGAPAETPASEDQNVKIIPSPIVGTFYRSPSPTADPFIKIGSVVEPDSIVCIIEAMKLMNEIQADISGEVVKIYVENGQPVEYGQPLFGIKS
jgi:acetyl-CoA carboxylase biotin carboxyl carrier protein